MKYRDPYCYIYDLVDMTGKSYRTAQRTMERIRKYYGISGRQKPTIEQVKSFLIAQ